MAEHKEKKLILVWGATGSQGGSVIDNLLKDGGFHVRAPTRDPSKENAQALAKRGVEVVKGNYFDVAGLPALNKGCYGVFVNINFWEPELHKHGGEFAVGRKVVDAAKAAGVQHVVYGALADADYISKGKYHVPHFSEKWELMRYIETQRFAYTSFPSPCFYYQNFLGFFPPTKQADGSLGITIAVRPDTMFAAFDVEDQGPPVLASFNNPKGWNHAFVPLAGSYRPLREYAEVLGKATGHKVSINYVPVEVFKSFPFPAAAELGNMFGWFDEYGYFGPGQNLDLGYAMHPKLNSFENWVHHNQAKLKAVYDKAAAGGK